MSTEPSSATNAEGCSPTLDQIEQLLLDPRTYPDRPSKVEKVETHISLVFLTDRFVYKLRKPIRLEFLDFSTPDARRRDCETELRLNRRLAPDVYRAVIPIVRRPTGKLSLGGAGEPVDWVVEMRRLPQDRMLDELVRAHAITDSDVNRLAAQLATFYVAAPPVDMPPHLYRLQIERHVRANREELLAREHDLPSDLVRRIHVAQLTWLAVAPEIVEARATERRIVDGHGDLRPEHICLETAPVVFDCVEFSDELRQVDALDELAFLAMECELLDASSIGETILQAYSRLAQDPPPVQLLAFYKGYRACVRAKVAVIRAHQLQGVDRDGALAQAQRYLKLADGHRSYLGKPWMMVVRGVSGSGKTTLARELATTLGAEHLQTDVIRQEQFGESEGRQAIGEGRYSKEIRGRVYKEMFLRAARMINAGVSVVLDGAFLTSDTWREALQLKTPERGVLAVHCECSPEIARDRIRDRAAGIPQESEAWPGLVDQQLAEIEPIPAALPQTTIVTTVDLKQQIAQVLGCLRSVIIPQLTTFLDRARSCGS